ncbi:MAG: SRPBCC family protein [Bacteroidales bacterium]
MEPDTIKRIKSYTSSGVTVLESEQLVNANIEAVWDFFSSPANLSKITPPEMNFRITGTDFEKKAYPGQIITYRLSPFRHISVDWVTEITVVKELSFFIDEQRFGPYRFWHHRHFFEKAGTKTLMKDIVTYKVPGLLFAPVINKLLIKPRVTRIFEHRFKKVMELFPDQ